MRGFLEGIHGPERFVLSWGMVGAASRTASRISVNIFFPFVVALGSEVLTKVPNIQSDPLMEQLDWFFTSSNWIIDFANMMVFPLAMPASDHVPCMVNIGIVIPKATIFRFEIFWDDLLGRNLQGKGIVHLLLQINSKL